jgi:hypothetical protein
MRYSGAPWSTSIPVAATAALLGAAVTLLTTARNLLDAIDVGAIGLGMSALGRQDDESGTPTPVSVPSQPAGQTLTTRAIAEETGGARRAVVGEL